MTARDQKQETPPTSADAYDSHGGASYTLGNSIPGGAGNGVSKGLAPGPGGPGDAPRQGARSGRGSTEGGRTPGGGTSPSAAASPAAASGADTLVVGAVPCSASGEPSVDADPAFAERKRLYGRGQRTAHSTRFSAEEWARISAASASVGMTPAGFVGAVAVAAAESAETARAGVLDVRGIARELMRTMAQLGHLGSNVNQIARILNSGGRAPVDFPALEARITTVLNALEEAAQCLAGR